MSQHLLKALCVFVCFKEEIGCIYIKGKTHCHVVTAYSLYCCEKRKVRYDLFPLTRESAVITAL